MLEPEDIGSVPRSCFSLVIGAAVALVIAGIGWKLASGPGLLIGSGIGTVVGMFTFGLTRYELAQIPLRKTPEKE